MDVPFLDLKKQYLAIKSEVRTAIDRVFDDSQFVFGSDTFAFEKEFTTYCGAQYGISVNSGTDALILGIRGLDLSASDEVIVPANTFFATALAVVENGARLVLCDSDPIDHGINLDDLKVKITSRTKAIIIVHLFGQPDKIDEIKKIIKKHRQKIYLIEDACQAHGAEYKGIKIGSFGIFSAFSFYPGKNLGAYGDGGMIITNDKKLAHRYELLRQYGAKKKYYHDTIGLNSRLDTLQSAVLRVKLKYLDVWNKKRQDIAQKYTELLKDIPYLTVPTFFSDRKSTFHLYVIQTEKRNALQTYLQTKHISTLIHYPIPLHLLKCFIYLNYNKGSFPHAEHASNTMLSLPMYPELTNIQIEYVAKNIKQFFYETSKQ